MRRRVNIGSVSAALLAAEHVTCGHRLMRRTADGFEFTECQRRPHEAGTECVGVWPSGEEARWTA